MLQYVELDSTVNKYVQFVKYNLFIVFMLHMLYKNSKHMLAVS